MADELKAVCDLLTTEERDVILHTVLGGQRKRGGSGSTDDVRPGFYRNRFVTGPGSMDWETCNRLVAVGFMDVRRNPEMFGGSDAFWLTEQGLDVAEALTSE